MRHVQTLPARRRLPAFSSSLGLSILASGRRHSPTPAHADAFSDPGSLFAADAGGVEATCSRPPSRVTTPTGRSRTSRTTSGPRLSGSAQAQKAVEYVAGELKALGLEVQLEKVMVPHWVRGEETAALVQFPGQAPKTTQKIVLTALGGSVATPADGSHRGGRGGARFRGTRLR